MKQTDKRKSRLVRNPIWNIRSRFTDEVSQTYNMPTGVYIAQALEGTAAEAAGLQKGDILIKFDGQRVDTMAELQEILTYYPAGTTVELVIQRPDGDEYDEVNVTVTLGSKASQQ